MPRKRKTFAEISEKKQKFKNSGHSSNQLFKMENHLKKKTEKNKKAINRTKRYFSHYSNGKYYFVNLSLKKKGHDQN